MKLKINIKKVGKNLTIVFLFRIFVQINNISIMENNKILLTFDEWDGRPGFVKKFEHKIMLVDKLTDAASLENKLVENINIYGLEELEIITNEDGEFNLGRIRTKKNRVGNKDKKRREKAGEAVVKS